MHSWTKSNVEKKLDTFKKFLGANGAELLENTNEYELIRFRAAGITGIIYFNKKNGVTFVGPAQKAWEAFKSASAWSSGAATIRNRKSTVTIRSIRKRDGDQCFFCLEYVSIADESEEHLVPITAGGPQHISNKFLAHKACNARAGHISAPEKIAIHVHAHLKKSIIEAGG